MAKILVRALCGKRLTAPDRALLASQGLSAPGVATTPIAPSGATTPAPPSSSQSGSSDAGDITRPQEGGGRLGTSECSDDVDNDGDGQVDGYAGTGTFVDPGCSGSDGPTETGERTVARQCGLGIYTTGSPRGYGVDFDAISFDDCPKNLVRGIVDVDVDVTCDDWGFEGTKAGNCTTINGNAVLSGARGDQWQVRGTAAGGICGKQAYLLSWQEDGTAWEYQAQVFDAAGVCGPTPNECANGLDDDGDGQVDAGGSADAAADPGCSSRTGSTETSETAFPAGCVGVLAFEPGAGNARRVTALTGVTEPTASCPEVDKVWIDLASAGIVDCGTPQWGGAEGGICALATGDSFEATGGPSADFVLGLDIGVDATCALDGQGTFAMRAADGTVHEMPLLVAVVTERGVETCS